MLLLSFHLLLVLKVLEGVAAPIDVWWSLFLNDLFVSRPCAFIHSLASVHVPVSSLAGGGVGPTVHAIAGVPHVGSGTARGAVSF